MADALKGRSAVVTGAGRGIGREIALALATEGAKVVVNDPGVERDGTGAAKSPADDTVAEIKRLGGQAVANYDSVSDFDAAGRIVKTCVDNFGAIHILCNVAGVVRERMCWNMSPEEFDVVVKVHLYGTFNTCRHAVPFMKEQKWGRIINTSSMAANGATGQCNYGAAKAGILGLTRSLANELGRSGITCNAIMPEAATRMSLTPEVLEGLKKRVAAGIWTKEKYDRVMSDLAGPEYVPPIVVYLATDHASNINAAVFACGSGKVAVYPRPSEAFGIYKNWKKDGAWSLDELVNLVPNTLMAGDNSSPATAQPEKK